MSASVIEVEAASTTKSLVMYVQLRVRPAATAKCMTALESLAGEHPHAVFTIAGVSRDARYLNLTLAIDLGDGVARFSEQSVAAYNFVNDLMKKMFDYLPAYAAEPTAVERDAAASIITMVATAAPKEPVATIATMTPAEEPTADTITAGIRQVA